MTTQKAGSDKLPDRQFQIAIIFIAGFFIFLAVSLVQFLLTMDSEALKLVGALFGGWVGTIIGFYFGQRPVEQVKKQLDEERKRTKELTDYIQTRSEDMWKRIGKEKEGNVDE